MKRSYIGVLLALALFLAACSESGEVSDVTFRTNHTADGRSVICDDDTTDLEYSFTYTPNLLGELESWTQRLVGQNTGRTGFERTFRPGDDQVSFAGTTYTVDTIIPAASAPLSIDGQAIIVEPVVIGQSVLELTVRGSFGDTQTFRSRPIDVIDCF
jgi:hypothetical protein